MLPTVSFIYLAIYILSIILLERSKLIGLAGTERIQ